MIPIHQLYRSGGPNFLKMMYELVNFYLIPAKESPSHIEELYKFLRWLPHLNEGWICRKETHVPRELVTFSKASVSELKRRAYAIIHSASHRGNQDGCVATSLKRPTSAHSVLGLLFVVGKISPLCAEISVDILRVGLCWNLPNESVL